MNRKIFTLILAFAFTTLAFAQKVALSYEINPADDQGFELNVYAQSYNEESFDLSALNLSAALPEGCVRVDDAYNMMTDSWSNYLELGTEVEKLSLQYDAFDFNHRFQYGNADPGLPATSAIILPPSTTEPLLILSQKFKGNCADLYLEHQSENRLNQITGPDMKPVDYVIRHPQRVAEEDDFAVMLVDVAPNPTTDWAKVSLVDAEDSWYTVKVFDMNGRLVVSQEKEMGPATETTTAIDLRREAAGIYIIEVMDKMKDRGHALKVVKQ